MDWSFNFSSVYFSKVQWACEPSCFQQSIFPLHISSLEVVRFFRPAPILLQRLEQICQANSQIKFSYFLSPPLNILSNFTIEVSLYPFSATFYHIAILLAQSVTTSLIDRSSTIISLLFPISPRIKSLLDLIGLVYTTNSIKMHVIFANKEYLRRRMQGYQ